MSIKYAYSLDGEKYQGEFDTREAALARAIARAHAALEPPQSVFVARMVPADPQAEGHAQAVIHAMHERGRDAQGETGSTWLRRVSEHQEAALDEALTGVILAWLKQHELMPTHRHVQSISEHALPIPTATPSGNTQREVSDMGASNYPVEGI